VLFASLVLKSRKKEKAKTANPNKGFAVSRYFLESIEIWW